MNIKIDALNYYGGVNTGEAAADNHHVGFNIFPQRRKMEVVFLRRVILPDDIQRPRGVL
jgi:hypothetical protein